MTKALLVAIALLGLVSCAGLQQREPIDVIVVGVEPLEGQGLELRMLVKLRVQNPNDAALDFNGVSLQMDVQGKRFATGVSDATGSVPRFGETIISVPVSISMFRIARQAIGVMSDKSAGKLEYELIGRLSGPAFNSARFSSKGEFSLPAEAPASE